MIPKILEFYTSRSPFLTTKLLHAKREGGRPAFNFTDLRRLSISSFGFKDKQNIRYLLQNAKLLEELHLTNKRGRILVGLHDILSLSASTLKVFDLKISLCDISCAGLCEGLETMAGHNMLEVLSIEVQVDGDETEDSVTSIIQNVEKVLVKPGWSALKQVSFIVSIGFRRVSMENSARLSKALQSLPDKYPGPLSKLKSVTFNFSVRFV